MKKLFFLLPIFLLILFPEQSFAKEIDVNGYYGVVKCTEIFHTSGQYDSDYVDCAYVQSNTISGDSTTYTMLEKAVSDFTGQYYNYSIVSRVFLFGYFDFKKDNYYTLNFTYNTGSFVTNDLVLTSLSDLKYSYMGSTDYVENQGLKELSYSQSFDYSTFTGYISITFKATENTSSYRFIVDKLPLFRNTSFEYNQGVRVYLLNALEEEDNTSALLGQITNQNNTMINQNQQIINNGNQLNDNLTNDNIEGATDSAGSFFDNFTDNDNGGISGIVTAPLVAINAMLNGTCSPLTTTFKGKEISLQCGTQLWSRLSGLKDFLNVVLGGLLCYRICIKLFKLIQNMKNPDNDRVEVMDL